MCWQLSLPGSWWSSSGIRSAHPPVSAAERTTLWQKPGAEHRAVEASLQRPAEESSSSVRSMAKKCSARGWRRTSRTRSGYRWSAWTQRPASRVASPSCSASTTPSLSSALGTSPTQKGSGNTLAWLCWPLLAKIVQCMFKNRWRDAHAHWTNKDEFGSLYFIS